MPKGIFERKPRVWFDAQGNRRESMGRPSKEEQEARRKGMPREPQPADFSPVEKTPAIHVYQPVTIEKDDAYNFIALANNVSEILKKMEKISKNPTESRFLRDINTIISRDMLPKYREVL